MAHDIRPEVSQKNPFWIGKHRYYELKHFCLQCKDRVKLQAFIEIATIPFWQVPSVFASCMSFQI